jgi:hypothetical protein
MDAPKNKKNKLSKKLPPTSTFDAKRYEHYLDGCDLTDDQKQKFLETLWNIMVCFVNMGFGLEPTQTACGQLIKSLDNPTPKAPNPVKSHHTSLHRNFKDQAVSERSAKEGVPV